MALVAPDFFGGEAGFFQRHGAQIEARTTAGVIHQFGKGVAQTACSHVVNGEDGVVRAGLPALVDDFLSAAFNFRVAALYRVKIQRCGVGTRRHRAGRAATHADAHARAAELDEQTAGWEEDFVGQIRINHTQTAGNHDGLVVAALLGIYITRDALLVLAEVAQQVRTTKLVVERSTAQRAFNHDLQRAGDVFRFTVSGLIRFTQPQSPFILSLSKDVKIHLRHSKPRQPRFGLRTAPCRAFVPNLATCTSRRTGEGGDRCWVVVRFDLHQHMLQFAIIFIATQAVNTPAIVIFSL